MGRGRPQPHPGWGGRPPATRGERTPEGRTHVRRLRADSVTFRPHAKAGLVWRGLVVAGSSPTWPCGKSIAARVGARSGRRRSRSCPRSPCTVVAKLVRAWRWQLQFTPSTPPCTAASSALLVGTLLDNVLPRRAPGKLRGSSPCPLPGGRGSSACGRRHPSALRSGRSGRARWPSWSSKPVRPCNPRLGRFDSGAAPFSRFQHGFVPFGTAEFSPFGQPPFVQVRRDRSCRRSLMATTGPQDRVERRAGAQTTLPASSARTGRRPALGLRSQSVSAD